MFGLVGLLSLRVIARFLRTVHDSVYSKCLRSGHRINAAAPYIIHICIRLLYIIFFSVGLYIYIYNNIKKIVLSLRYVMLLYTYYILYYVGTYTQPIGFASRQCRTVLRKLLISLEDVSAPNYVFSLSDPRTT